MIDVMIDLGFEKGALSKEVFLKNDAIVRMGLPPLRRGPRDSPHAPAPELADSRGLKNTVWPINCRHVAYGPPVRPIGAVHGLSCPAKILISNNLPAVSYSDVSAYGPRA